MKLLGIAVCGGYSTRMGSDKALLKYSVHPQFQQVAEMLSKFCEQVVISCRPAQMQTLNSDFPKMPDLPEYAECGPMSALLTAAECYPDFDYMLVGCDYPFLTAAELSRFFQSVENYSRPSAFASEGKSEPLLAFYPNSLIASLRQSFEQKQLSLRHFLQQHHAVQYIPQSPDATYNANTYAEYLRAKTALSQVGPNKY